MAVLKVLKGLTPGQLIPLDGNSLIMGRHPECDIVLDVPAVSRQHVQITREGGAFYVEDLRSRNGTFLNGEVVVGRRPLQENDELRVCDLVFEFHLAPLGETPPPPSPNDLTTTAMLVDDGRPSSGSTIMSKVNIAGGSASLQLEVNAEAKLRALIEISQSLGKAIELSEVLPKVLDSLFSIFVQADRGFVILCDPNSGKLIPKAIKYRRQGDQGTARISRTVVNSVIQSKEAILSADAASDARFEMAESIVDFHIRSMMCAPLVTSDGKALGVIQIDTVDQRKRFNREDLDVLASVACLAAYAVENAQLHDLALREQAFEHELAVAHEVQRRFLPAHAPKLPGYEFFDFYEPANQVGGDYFDYVPLPGGRVGVVVADVSGKGISASLLMARFSAETRYVLATESSPESAVRRLNQGFCDSNYEDRFITFVLAVLDPQRHEVTVVNAGHVPALMRDKDGAVRVLAEAETGLPLGIDADYPYESQTSPWNLNDSLVLYTDGITEARNAQEELYGYRRLWGQVADSNDSIPDLGKRILDDVKRFVGGNPQSDDMCLTCLGRAEVADPAILRPTRPGSR